MNLPTAQAIYRHPYVYYKDELLECLRVLIIQDRRDAVATPPLPPLNYNRVQGAIKRLEEGRNER